MKNGQILPTFLLPLLSFPGLYIGDPTTPTSQQVVVSYSMTAQEISLNEPVSLNLVVQNNSPEPIKLDLGNDRKGDFQFNVTRPDGKAISLPPRRNGGFRRVGLVAIEPSQEYRQKLLLNEWIDFSLVGRYDIEVRLFHPGLLQQETVPDDLFTFRITLTVRPRDPAHLEAVCAYLAGQVESAPSYESATESAVALSYVRDPVAVPYLQMVLHARPLVDGFAIDGLERIANEAAVRVLISALATSETPETARLARAALQRIVEKTADQGTRRFIEDALESADAKKP